MNPYANCSLLVIDDTPEIREVLQLVLSTGGFTQVSFAQNCEEALQLTQTQAFELAICDIMLPDGDGLNLSHKLKENQRRFFGQDMALIFLSAKDRPEDRVSGLMQGADDYLVKPFSSQELILRIMSILRRCAPQSQDRLKLSACEVDLDAAEVHYPNGSTTSLTAKEHKLLETLSLNRGRIVSTDSLCEALWGADSFGYENTLMTHVRRLRAKIEANPSKPQDLLTAKGLGYKLVLGD